MQVEEKLSNGYYAEARTLLAGITTENTIDANYKIFYNLFANYQEVFESNNAYSPDDSTILVNLASLCPGTNGACIYQARALYNSIYNLSTDNFGCNDFGARVHQTNQNSSKNIGKNLKMNRWDIEFFPNPATNQITIVSNAENEDLKIIVKDLSGRTLQIQNLKTSNFISNLNLSLINGAYFITIANTKDEWVIKKLLIAK